MSKNGLRLLHVGTMILILLLLEAPQSNALDFDFVRTTDKSACIKFRPSESSQWAYVNASGITPRTAERLCKTYYPSALTGIITSFDYGCHVSGGGYRYTSTIDCADANAPVSSSCTVGGDSASPHYYSSSFYAAGIKCITDLAWQAASGSFSRSVTHVTTFGQYGSQTNRSISVSPIINVSGIRPEWSFAYGTICLPSNLTNDVDSNNNLAKALCRSAGFPATTKSSILNGSVPNVMGHYPQYASNIQCSSSPTATLWNNGCISTTHFYGMSTTPTTTYGCSPNISELSCPSPSFDIRLGEPIDSARADRGYQLIEVAPGGSNNYDGVMCIDQPHDVTVNFANAMCHELYGDDLDFAASYRSYDATGAISLQSTREYLTAVRCSIPSVSATFTSLSQCFASITATPTRTPCSGGTFVGMVSCKLSHTNSMFSIKSVSASAGAVVPGKGYLMASVAAAGQATPGEVCSDGFDQVAALAACRSVGYTPGPSASFTVATTVLTHAINNVSCPPGAKNLTECKLQYSGTGYKISESLRQVCSGRVLLDCDVGTPSAVQYRTINYYLQVRLFPNAEWGWVVATDTVTGTGGYNSMCAYAINYNSQAIISSEVVVKSYLYLTYCPSWATSYTDCTFEYTNGVRPSRREYLCPASLPPATTTSTTPNSNNGNNNEGSNSNTAAGSSDGLGTGGIIGVTVGAVAFAFLVIFLVAWICYMRFRAPMYHPNPPADTSFSWGHHHGSVVDARPQQPVVGTAYTGDEEMVRMVPMGVLARGGGGGQDDNNNGMAVVVVPTGLAGVKQNGYIPTCDAVAPYGRGHYEHQGDKPHGAAAQYKPNCFE